MACGAPHRLSCYWGCPISLSPATNGTAIGLADQARGGARGPVWGGIYYSPMEFFVVEPWVNKNYIYHILAITDHY